MVSGWTPGNPAAQIANVHVIFNITTTILLLPFGNMLASLSEKLLPDRKEKDQEDHWLDEMLSHQHMLGASSVAITSLLEDAKEMLSLAEKNVVDGFLSAKDQDGSKAGEIQSREEEIDLYNVRISKKLSKILAAEQSLPDIKAFNGIFTMAGNIERIGDHAMNLSDCGKRLQEKGLAFSEESKEEISQMLDVCKEAFLVFDFTGASLPQIEKLEQKIDDMTEEFRRRQLERINVRKCELECAILYSELLTDFERIGDHFLNLAEASLRLSPEN